MAYGQYTPPRAKPGQSVAPIPPTLVPIPRQMGEELGIQPDNSYPSGFVGPQQNPAYSIPFGGSYPGYQEDINQIGELRGQVGQQAGQNIENDPTYGMVQPQLYGQIAGAQAALSNYPTTAPHREFAPYTPPPLPPMPLRHAPSVSGPGAILAGIGGLIAPRAAGNFGANLIEGARGQAAQEYQDALQRHSQDLQERDEAVRYALSNLRGSEQNKALNDIADYDLAVKRGLLQAQLAGPQAEAEYESGTVGPAMKLKALAENKLQVMRDSLDALKGSVAAKAQGFNIGQEAKARIIERQIPAIMRYEGSLATGKSRVDAATIQANARSIAQQYTQGKIDQRAALRAMTDLTTNYGSDAEVAQQHIQPFLDAVLQGNQPQGNALYNPLPGMGPSLPGTLPGLPGMGIVPSNPAPGAPLPGRITTAQQAMKATQAHQQNMEANATAGRQQQALDQQRKILEQQLSQAHQDLVKNDALVAFGSKGQRKNDPEAQAKIKPLWDRYYAVQGQLADIKRQQAGLSAGQPQAALSSIQEGATATNPKTGQRVIFKGGKWSPL